MDRRQFIRTTGAAGAATLCGSSFACATAAGTAGAASAAAARQRFPLSDVGLQLYTVRTVMQQGVDRGLEQVAAAGYRLVETAGTYNLEPSQLRALFDKHGIRSTAGHYPLADVETKSDAVFATAKALGQEYVVVPWLDAPARTSMADYLGLADRFNRIGARARAAGLRFAYHNHDFELEKFGGATPALDTLIQRTDAALVSYELDAYWVYKAGADPASYVTRYPGRVTMMHVKDGTAAPARAMVDVGKGVMDYPALLATAKANGLRYAFVEHDQPAEPIASIRASRDHLVRVLAAQ